MNVDYNNFGDTDSKPDRMYQTGNTYTCPERNHIYCKCHLNISHFMERSIFVSKDTMGKLTVHFNIL